MRTIFDSYKIWHSYRLVTLSFIYVLCSLFKATESLCIEGNEISSSLLLASLSFRDFLLLLFSLSRFEFKVPSHSKYKSSKLIYIGFCNFIVNCFLEEGVTDVVWIWSPNAGVFYPVLEREMLWICLGN